MKKNKFFLLVLGLPVFVLLCMPLKPLQATCFGDTIKLQTAPVDPRDLLYGDYVILDFEVERIGLNQLDKGLLSKFTVEEEKYRGEFIRYLGEKRSIPVYLVLIDAGDVHQIQYVTENKPSSGTYIKGILNPNSGWENVLTVDLPIERYYVQENTGKQLEKLADEGKITAEIKVYNGYAVLKNISASTGE